MPATPRRPTSTLRLVAGLGFLLASGASAAADGTASLTLGSLFDTESGTAYDLDGYWGPTANWGVGLGFGRLDTRLPGADFSGSTWRGSSDVTIGQLNLRAAYRSWEDSSQVSSDASSFEASWFFDSGFSITALVESRSLTTTYQITAPLGRTRNARLDLDADGFGVELGWLGDRWDGTLRYVDYSYGATLDRVRNTLRSPTTVRFPQIQALVDTVLTRNVAPIDQEFVAGIGRRFDRASLRAEWFVQRDALTAANIQSLSLRYGYRLTDHVELAGTAGFLDASGSSLGFGGLALTLRR